MIKTFAQGAVLLLVLSFYSFWAEAESKNNNSGSSAIIDCPETISSAFGFPAYANMGPSSAWLQYDLLPPSGWSKHKTKSYSNHVFKVQGHHIEGGKLICYYGNSVKSAGSNASMEMWFHSIHKAIQPGNNCQVLSGYRFQCKLNPDTRK